MEERVKSILYLREMTRKCLFLWLRSWARDDPTTPDKSQHETGLEVTSPAKISPNAAEKGDGTPDQKRRHTQGNNPPQERISRQNKHF